MDVTASTRKRGSTIMTIKLKLYNKNDTYLQYYVGGDSKHWWRLKQGDDVIGGSHQGWKDKQQCIYNARYIITSEWDIAE